MTAHRSVEPRWDVIVIGAGPAGSSAARAAASSGARTLLVDRARFPRPKVCGGCLNAAAIDTLARSGADPTRQAWGDSPFNRARVLRGGRSTGFALRPGISVDRATLDQWLVERAVHAGASFLDGVRAEVRDTDSKLRPVRLAWGDRITDATARVVIAATGLERAGGEPPARVAPHSRIGLCAVTSDTGAVAPGEIVMAVAREGYVGLVRLGDGRLDIAASVRPDALRDLGADGVVRTILGAAAMPDAVPAGVKWHGTPPITRRRDAAATRLLFVGDAASFVEPITGEGMAWAIASGLAAGRLAGRAHAAWSPSDERVWRAAHARLVRRRQRACRAIRALLGSRVGVSAAVGVLGLSPRFGELLAAITARPYRVEAYS